MNDEILTKLAEALMTLKCHGQFEIKIENVRIDGSSKTTTIDSIIIDTKFSQNEGVTSKDEESIL